MGTLAKPHEFDRRVIRVEVFGNGKWHKREMELTEANIAELSDRRIHDMSDDDSHEIQVRLPKRSRR